MIGQPQPLPSLRGDYLDQRTLQVAIDLDFIDDRRAGIGQEVVSSLRAVRAPAVRRLAGNIDRRVPRGVCQIEDSEADFGDQP